MNGTSIRRPAGQTAGPVKQPVASAPLLNVAAVCCPPLALLTTCLALNVGASISVRLSRSRSAVPSGRWAGRWGPKHRDFQAPARPRAPSGACICMRICMHTSNHHRQLRIETRSRLHKRGTFVLVEARTTRKATAGVDSFNYFGRSRWRVYAISTVKNRRLACTDANREMDIDG